MAERQLTTDQEEQLRRLLRNARSILKASAAAEIAKPFDFDIAPLVWNLEKGVNFGAGYEAWGSGDSVSACTLASYLQEHLGAPDIKYDTDYGGEGKRAEAITVAAVIAIEVHMGVERVTCEMCGTYDVHPSEHNGLCFLCHRELRDDYEPDVHSSSRMVYDDPRGRKVTEWWVNPWADKYSRTFPTRAKARAHAALNAEAQRMCRERFDY